MMKTINEINEIWDKSLGNDSGFLLADHQHPIEFHLGYENGQKCLIALNVGKIEDLSSSKAITAANVLVGNKYSLMLKLINEAFDEMYVKLCWDLIETTRESKEPKKTLVERFSKWQAFLQKVPEDILSVSQQKGLIGELLYLESLIEEVGVQQALSYWVGPEGEDQDFITDEYWAEIKTTNVSSDSVLISSLQQLDRDETGYLVVYFIDKTDSSGLSSFSLKDVYERILSTISAENEKDVFKCKLAKVGFRESLVDKYNKTLSRFSGKKMYSIIKGFPKLVVANIPSGVIEAKYRISLSSIDKYRI